MQVRGIVGEQLAKRVKKATSLISVMAVRSIKKNFEVGGRPAWPKSKKRGKLKGTKTLVVSGELSNVSASVEFTTRNTNAINPNVDAAIITLTTSPRSRAYARIHNEGGTINVPAKPIRLREKEMKDGTSKSVFARKSHKKNVTVKQAKAHVIVIPKREFMIVPEEDINEIVRKVNGLT